MLACLSFLKLAGNADGDVISVVCRPVQSCPSNGRLPHKNCNLPRAAAHAELQDRLCATNSAGQAGAHSRKHQGCSSESRCRHCVARLQEHSARGTRTLQQTGSAAAGGLPCAERLQFLCRWKNAAWRHAARRSVVPQSCGFCVVKPDAYQPGHSEAGVQAVGELHQAPTALSRRVPAHAEGIGRCGNWRWDTLGRMCSIAAGCQEVLVRLCEGSDLTAGHSADLCSGDLPCH